MPFKVKGSGNYASPCKFRMKNSLVMVTKYLVPLTELFGTPYQIIW